MNISTKLLFCCTLFCASNLFAKEINSEFDFPKPSVNQQTGKQNQITGDQTLLTGIPEGIIQSDTQTPEGSSALLQFTVTDNNINFVDPGDSIFYQLSLSNIGSQVATGTVITERVPEHTAFNATLSNGSWACDDVIADSICTLFVGDLAEEKFEVEFVVDVISSVPAGTTQTTNAAMAEAINADLVFANELTDILSAPILSIDVTDNDQSVEPGQSIVYAINYANIGDQDDGGVTINGMVLPQTTFDASNSSPGWVCNLDSCVYDVGQLGGGQNGSLTFALLLNNPVDELITELNNTATIAANNSGPLMANETTPIIANPDLRLVKTDGDITTSLNQLVTYNLSYYNDGNRKAINMTMTETVPEYTTFQPAQSTPGWSCIPDNLPGASCTLPLNNLDGDAQSSVVFVVKTDQNIFSTLTELSNTATVTASNAPTSSSDTAVTPIDIVRPKVTSIKDGSSNTNILQCQEYDITTNQLEISFLDNRGNFQGLDDFDNYLLINTGADHDVQTLSCHTLLGDDSEVLITNINVSNTSNSPKVTLELATSLQSGVYALLLCDGIKDDIGNTLNLLNTNYPENEHLIHPFRIELGNLFKNAHLDFCGPVVNDPPFLWDWNVVGSMQTSILIDSETDHNQSDISRSLAVHSFDGTDAGVSQCQTVNSGWPYRIGASVLGDLMQNNDGELKIHCESSSQTNCSDVLSVDEKVLIQTSAPGQWSDYEALIWTDPAAVAARCSITLSNDSEEVNAYFDEFKWHNADLIFVNGFDNP